MKRVLTPWQDNYLHGEEYKDEYQLEIYRDEREEGIDIENAKERRASLIFQNVFFPSLLSREIMPNFLLSSGFIEEFGVDLQNIIRSFYILLFESEIRKLKFTDAINYFPCDWERVVLPPERTFGNFLCTYQLPLFSVTCSVCEKEHYIQGENKTLDSLYLDKNNFSNKYGCRFEDSSPLCGYCEMTNKFVCKWCDPVIPCLSCFRIVRKSSILDSGNCIQCIHNVVRPRKKLRCEIQNHSKLPMDHSYTRLYQCSGCEKKVCNYDSIHITGSDITICLYCAVCSQEGPKTEKVFFENEEFQRIQVEISPNYIEEEYEFDRYWKEKRDGSRRIITDITEYVSFLRANKYRW